MTTYPRSGMQRILAGAPSPDLRVTLLDQDGDALAPAGAVTCTITRADGTVVATDRAATNEGEGVCTVSLSTDEGRTLDVLKAVWSASGVVQATSWHRTVGGFIYSIRDLARRAGIAESTDDAELRVERDRITDLIERYTGPVSPRYELESWQGRGSCHHVLRHRPVRALRSVSIDEAVLDVAGFEVDTATGVLEAEWSVFYDECTAGYECGMDAPPADLRDAALMASADKLKRDWNTSGPRVRSMTTDMGQTMQFGYAGADHPTGLDEVDAVIMSYDTRVPGIA